MTPGTKGSDSDDQALCPICGRELNTVNAAGSWMCRCGEIIPAGLEVSPRMRPPATNAQSFTAELESAVRQGRAGRKKIS